MEYMDRPLLTNWHIIADIAELSNTKTVNDDYESHHCSIQLNWHLNEILILIIWRRIWNRENMTDFNWPWEYSFPPFFTIQMQAKTREIQLNSWADLVMKYQQSLNQPIININDENTELFVNKELNRRLNVDGRAMVMDTLEKSAHAAPIDPKKRDKWEVYWYTLDELGNMIYKWALDNAMLGQVCTLFEVASGDNSVDQQFHDLSLDVVLKALRRLEQLGKCELIDDEGVKFF